MSLSVGVPKEIKPLEGRFEITAAAAAPRGFSRSQVAQMQPGSVVADISVDHCGCIETTRASTYDAAAYMEEGVVHFCVANRPGAVRRSATQALSAAI